MQIDTSCLPPLKRKTMRVDYKFLNELTKNGFIIQFGFPGSCDEKGNAYRTAAFRITQEAFEDGCHIKYFLENLNKDSALVIRTVPEILEEGFYTGELLWRFRFYNEGCKELKCYKSEGAVARNFFDGK